MPFALSDADALRTLIEHAGFRNVELSEASMEASFPEPERFVWNSEYAYAAVIPAFAVIPDAFRRFLEAVETETREAIRPYRRAEHIAFPMRANIATARRSLQAARVLPANATLGLVDSALGPLGLVLGSRRSRTGRVRVALIRGRVGISGFPGIVREELKANSSDPQSLYSVETGMPVVQHAAEATQLCASPKGAESRICGPYKPARFSRDA